MADKPSRALVLYGYGLAPYITPFHSHIHALASRSSCGFLAIDDSSPTPEFADDKLIRELAELLDANEAVEKKDFGSEALKKLPNLNERFMGMRAAIISSSPTVKCFGEKLGFTNLEFKSADFAAEELLKMLGFQDGKTVDDHFDLVFVHIGSLVGEEGAQNDIDYVNSLVGTILQLAQHGSEIASRLHLTLIMSYGAVTVDDPNLSLLSLHDENDSDLQSLFPRQSYTLKGANPRNGIRHHSPILIAQWQDAVTRKDMAQEFSFSEFKENCGNLAIAADRFLHEIAFKLWKAPKYGA
ncbi:hypothetical protein SOVF_198730 [Spinacia oleracea]|uniref:Uncharacterized protein n=1 Tax=Spinacia oleracea TaxID=3562 RepID=A0A9R0JHL5_SPIOL|nr:uncharacterized protein LOC110775232 [Spinacia oleracea]KNA04544.1 hypothetical protein SOVF_198730 [Spinacia oleracea]